MTSATSNDVPQSVAPSIAFEIPIKKKVSILFVLCHLLLLLSSVLLSTSYPLTTGTTTQ